MIPQDVRSAVEPLTGALRSDQSVGGGCIANAARIDAANGTFFLKHATGQAALTFSAEAAGLHALRMAADGTALHVPRVLAVQSPEAAAPPDSGTGFLLLEWIPTGGGATPAYWERFGAALARLHRAAPAPGSTHGPGAGPYGFDGDNFIGRLPQLNDWRSDWPSFFRDLRLIPQFERAKRSGRWDTSWTPRADRLLSRLDQLLPPRPPPSLLHGDLWSGNQLADANGNPWLVDPAAYVGDREADLAMTELFGGFSSRFYDAYREEWPLDAGYGDRRDLYNLYHLVNHLNLFGGSYAASVGATLSRY